MESSELQFPASAGTITEYCLHKSKRHSLYSSRTQQTAMVNHIFVV